MSGLLDDAVYLRYRNRKVRKGHKVVRPVYPVDMALTRRLLRDCKLKAAFQRLIEEAYKRLRCNHEALKREERHEDEREVVGQVIGATLTNIEVYPLIEVPEEHDSPMTIGGGVKGD